jgi:putative hydrolase of the HAD superfamily
MNTHHITATRSAASGADAARPLPYDVLLLDFGGVCLVNPVERHTVVEDHFGLAPGTLTWMGPLDVEGDELYARSLADVDFTERDYWDVRAQEVGRRAGIDLDTFGYMHVAYALRESGDSLIRAEAIDVCERARRAGIGVSVLTNDLHAFHDEEWVSRIDFLQSIDHLIDCSHLGFLKPDRRAYELALETLRTTMPDVPADRVLFVDDRPLNVDGANSSGMEGMYFDIAAAGRSWAQVGDRLGL